LAPVSGFISMSQSSSEFDIVIAGGE